eukprot:356253_1
MSLVTFETLKCVDQYTIDLVTGYLKTNEDYRSTVTPQLVTNTCILFYFVKECFTEYGANITVNENQDIVTNQKTGRDTAYGTIEVDGQYEMIYEWTIKILQLSIFNIYFGIDSSPYPRCMYKNGDH